MDLGNQYMKKNSCKKYYKSVLIKNYEEILDNKLKCKKKLRLGNDHLT